MIDSLISITKSGEFEDNGGIFLQKLDRFPTELVLYVNVNLGTDSKTQSWIIKCINPKKLQLDDEFIGSLELTTEQFYYGLSQSWKQNSFFIRQLLIRHKSLAHSMNITRKQLAVGLILVSLLMKI
ncbi:MAG: hypothetical protein WDM76_09265 [Limisphaerales bacterium]